MFKIMFKGVTYFVDELSMKSIERFSARRGSCNGIGCVNCICYDGRNSTFKARCSTPEDTVKTGNVKSREELANHILQYLKIKKNGGMEEWELG